MTEYQFDMIVGTLWIIAAGFYHQTIHKIYLMFMGVGIMWITIGAIGRFLS